MGIPYYFYYLTTKYNDILIKSLPIKIDIYAIDFNGIIHPEAAKETNEELLINNLWDKINKYNDLYKPNKLLICVDGVAPIAKIIQQRKRRYLTYFKNKIDKITSLWDTNAISPGTNFMNKLNSFIKENITNDNYIFSGSDESGEGEHKIFKLINEIRGFDNDDNNIIINGLDADLIILSLISGRNNIYLMRENRGINTYVNINNLRLAIIKELRPKWHIEDDKDLIESYCVMCSILGNDFIPHILNLNIKSGGLDKLINITEIAIRMYGSLVENNKINQRTLGDIFNQIADNEDNDISLLVKNEIERKPRDFTLLSQEYGIKFKDETLNLINNNSKKWRYYYYKNLFDINITIDSTSIISSNYIKGIYWTYNYYKKMDIDYTWYYPYNYPPTAKDISNYFKVNDIQEIKSKGDFLKPETQLLLILPINSINLIDDKYKKYMTDISMGLKHLYPIEYKIQTLFKTHLWECCPILPIINIDKIIKINKLI
jgi:5'-3' exoribonuclease 2